LMEETPEEVSQYLSPTADPYIYHDQIAEVLADAPGEDIYQVLQEHFDEAEAQQISLEDVPGAYEVASAGDYIPMIDNTTVAPATFISDEGSTPSLPATTLGGPVVGETEQPVAQAVAEQPIEQAVAQALANTGQPVQQNLQALAALAQIDPSIAETYVPGSQALQDITTQVESFSEPTVEWTPPKKQEVKKVKKGPTPEEKAATRAANQAANKKLLAEKKDARVILRAKNAKIRAEKLADRESAKQTRIRKAAEKALALQREREKKARVEELKRYEDMLRFADETRKAYLARKKQEDELREAQGYGWGDMFT